LFLYLDEDLASKELATRLAAAGHGVLTTLRGVTDDAAWAAAQENGAVVVTQNAADFLPLAAATSGHRGLIVVYREGDARKDMQIAEIAAAVDRVQGRLGASLTGKVVILNEHR